MTPALAVLWIGQNVRRSISKNQAAAGVVGKLRFLGHLPGPHDARHGVSVGETECGIAEQFCGDRKFLRFRRPAQKRKIRLDGELDISGFDGRVHAKTPCMNQRGISAEAP
jgi:hypothetical protein